MSILGADMAANDNPAAPSVPADGCTRLFSGFAIEPGSDHVS